MTDNTSSPRPFSSALPAVIFVTSIFFCNFLSRVIFAPLMPVMQVDFDFTHAGAGHLFLALAVGNALGLFVSGLVSRALYHRRTVAFSAMLVGCCALSVPQAGSFWTLLLTVFALGVSVGLYLPSGIATVTSLVRKEDWGKTMALHELAPNAAYVTAPLLAEAVLLHFQWRTALYLLGAAQLCLAAWFLKAGKGGEYPGVFPGPDTIRRIVRRPVFWLLVLFMCTAVGASLGPYSMLPLYLSDAHGYTREQANQLLAISRIAGCFAPFGAGWITDRWGPKPAILLAVSCNCLTLTGLGLASGEWLVAMVLLQPVFSVLVFAPAFTVLAFAFEPQDRAVAISLMGPLNALFGLGLFPTLLGHMGDAGHFDLGFLLLAGVLLGALCCLPLLPGRAQGGEV
ncbi:MFS transporter [Pseudodesulfovibrio cashew]|uniref:MFS transporter n=1 Tax=Pseudodesulfovibrio cashew TaxID=2678688 RepID=A0A6I6JAG3_9BACT|nr:MFS transporter [Pseudodesulfovibrio cashew]QGY39051.1 MFS transporter [Pseudodesulfovibrio cashew]